MKRAGWLAACVVAAGACAGAGKQDPQKVSLTFQTQLDSGNAAYRRHDYKASVKFFNKAAKADPQNISGWYGVYMAETKLGNKEEAAKARAIVARMAPAMPLTAHPTAATQQQQPAANPHVPHGTAKAALPLDSIREAQEKK
jgi:tetratricopeptide (TPR) repeat protein